MTTRDKRLSKLRQNRNNVSFETLEALLCDLGFEFRSKHGSHYNYRHCKSPLILTIPRAKPLDPNYVKDVIDFIDLYVLDSED